MSMQSSSNNAKEIPENENSAWSDLPPELLDTIKYNVVISCKSSTSIISSVCKQWNRSNRFAFPADFSPLLIYKNKIDGRVLNYYSPLLNKTFIIPCLTDISNTVFHHASNGWLLLSRGDHELFLVNPFTGTTRALPNVSGTFDLTVCAFSTPPPLPPSPFPDDFMIFGVACHESFVFISLYGKGDWIVDHEWFDCNYPFVLFECTPIYRNGLFYCLDMSGRIATYNPTENEWLCLDKPGSIGNIGGDNIIERCYLLELNGELVAIFLEQRRMKISMLKLEEEEMEWVKMKKCRLDDGIALFLGYQDSIAAKVEKNSMSNKVFFRSLYGDEDVVEADVELFEGRIFFVPKGANLIPGSKRDGGMKRGIVSCPFENRAKFKFKNSRELVFSIWYEPLYF